VDHELRVCAAAQFVQVHANAFAVCVHTERNESIQRKKGDGKRRKKNAEQCGNAYELRQELPMLRREDSSGRQAPQSR
jgi:hypothetical protein